MWEKSSPGLVSLFAELAPKDPRVEPKKMFGWPCCFVNGNLFAGLHKEYMLFRLSEKDQVIFLKLDGAAEFEPMPGRKMKGYATLPPSHRQNARRRRSKVGIDTFVGRASACGRFQSASPCFGFIP